MNSDVKHLIASAELGDAEAQFNLALCYAYGRGVVKSEREALKWYMKAAEQGIAEAQFNLALYYDEGWGVAKNEREAIKWYTKAAELGEVHAQLNLAMMYGEGEVSITVQRCQSNISIWQRSKETNKR